MTKWITAILISAGILVLAVALILVFPSEELRQVFVWIGGMAMGWVIRGKADG